MIRENMSFLSCAECIETRAYTFYKSPFIFTEEDKAILSDSVQRDRLLNAMRNAGIPMFVIEHQPGNSEKTIDKYARMDSYILKLALLVYSIRLKINIKGDSERFMWTSSEECFEFLSELDHEQVIEALIRREISIRPVCELSEIMSGNWSLGSQSANKLMSQYLQIRFKQWRVA